MSTTRAVKLDGSQAISSRRAGASGAGGGPAAKSAESGNGKDKDKDQKKVMKKKRKADGNNGGNDDDEDGSESGSDVEFVNVDLDFFGYIESDYQAVKHLLTQLFSHDAKDLDVAGLTNHIIDEDEDVGSAVKSDGEQGDPLAFVAVVPWSLDQPHAATLRKYLLEKTAKRPKLQQALSDPSNSIGIVLQERLVNMPVQVVPPLLRTFDQELASAPSRFHFSHLLFISRVFLAGASDLQQHDDVEMADANGADDDHQPKPKSKKKKGKKKQKNTSDTATSLPVTSNESFLYHPEDEIVARLAGDDMWIEYAYSNAPARGGGATESAGDDFGVETRGRVALIPRSKLKDVYEQAEQYFAA